MSDLAATPETVLGDWAQAAACRGADPDIFHPIDGDYLLARSYCDRCVCRADCAAHALARGERDGMWGGLTPDQRRHLRRAALMAPEGL